MKKNTSWLTITFFLVLAVSPLLYKMVAYTRLASSGKPPTSIGEFLLIKDGPDLCCYFSLLDQDRNYTSADGEARLTVFDGQSGASLGKAAAYFHKIYSVVRSRFERTHIGYGVFRKKTVIYRLFRIPFAEWTATGDVNCSLEFKTNGLVLEKSVLFSR
ncbi:MAG: hypothetical protein PHQ23_17425 [Candidatus Wallbacteria bacterium]|nr:hypothetical protein [Candidatus Wallbacteria bacterium]